MGPEGDHGVVQQRLPGHVRPPRRQGGRQEGNQFPMTVLYGICLLLSSVPVQRLFSSDPNQDPQNDTFKNL